MADLDRYRKIADAYDNGQDIDIGDLIDAADNAIDHLIDQIDKLEQMVTILKGKS